MVYQRQRITFSSYNDKKLLNTINDIYTDYPYYGIRRMVVELKRRGFSASRKLVRKAYRYLGIQAFYPKPKIFNSDQESHPSKATTPH